MNNDPVLGSHKLQFAGLLLMTMVLGITSCNRQDSLAKFPHLVRDYIHSSESGNRFAKADSLKYEQSYFAAAAAFENLLGKKSISAEERIYASNQLAFIYLKLWENAKAQALIEQVERLYPRLLGAQAGDLWFNKGVLALHLIQPKLAKKYLSLALKYYTAYYPRYHLRLAQAKTALALYHYDYAPAIKDFENAAKDAFLTYYPKAAEANSPLHPYAAEIHFLMAHRYRSVARDYQAGLNHCEVAEFLIKSKTYQDTVLLGRCLGAKGLFLKKEGRFHEADSVLQRGLNLMLQTKPDHFLVQELYRFLSVNAAGRQDQPYFLESNNPEFPGSFAYCFKALKTHLAKYQQPEVYVNLNELIAYYYSPFYHVNNDLCRVASMELMDLASREKPAYRYYMEEALFFLARVNVLEENYSKSLDFQLRMFEALQLTNTGQKIKNWATAKTIQPNRLNTNPFGYHNQAGSTFLKKYKKEKVQEDLKQALAHFVLADSLMSLGLTMGEDGVLAYHQELNNEAYADALETIFLLCQAKPSQNSLYHNLAFRFIERQKSFILYREDLMEGSKEIKDSIKLIKKTAKQLNLLGQENSQNAFMLRTLASFRYQDLLAKLAQKASWKFNQKINSIPEIQAELKDKEVIVQYKAIRKEYFIVLALGKGKVVFEKLNHYDSIQQLVKKFFIDIEDSKNNSNLFRSSHAYSLHKELLSPIEAILPTKNAELIIIPDDFLINLPFGALTTTLRPLLEEEHRKAFLISKHYIAYTPSWKVWNHNRDVILPGKKHKAAFFTYDEKASSRNLFEWTKEWDAMKSFFGKRAYLYNRAQCTKDNFLNLAYRYKVIHFSLHGLSDPQQLRANKLFFSITRSGTENELNGIEIIDNDLQGKMVVLSACETNSGKITPEGVYSLSRAFIQAGCASTISSLWSVNEQSTAHLMQSFYKNLDGNSPWVALGKAQRSLIKEKMSPASWAGLIVTL